MTGNLQRIAPLFALFVLLALAGCGSDDNPTRPVPPADGLPAGTPAADTPAHFAQRLEATWESQVETEYAKLLTDDFHFRFSVSSDPLLVGAYGNNWKRAEEIDALTHLFHGFANAASDTIPGASTIDITMTGVQYVNDLEHSDSTAQYKKVVITSFDATIQVPAASEPVVYQISSRQELYLVRGDAAALPAGAVADSTRWYVRRWDDLSVGSLARKGPITHAARAASLGSMKALYHDLPTPPDGLPVGTPQADSPQNFALRLEATWESQVVNEYAKLITGDFRYHFSVQTDPMLVDRYPNWGFDDEVESTKHLFEGFTNTSGEAVPAANRIDLTLSGLSYQADFEHADSAAYYQKVVITNLGAVIEVPGYTEPITYDTSARHELYLVRGDAAVLPDGATADATRWYVRRWDDLATYGSSRKGPVINPAAPATLGRIKALYR
jgi:hypothetical protein